MSRSSSRHRVLIVNFAGLGNGIWIVPILQSLEKADAISAYYHLSNPVFAAPGIMEWLNLRKFGGTVPAAWRRFDKRDWESIRAFIKANRINVVANLRNEGPFRDIGYFEFMHASDELNVEFWNLDQALNLSRIMPRSLFADQIALFNTHGVDVRGLNRTWLRDYVSQLRSASRQASIGFFTGASQSVKRWGNSHWIELGRRLLAVTDRNIVIYAGQSHAEIQNARDITSALGADALSPRCSLVYGQTFEFLCSEISGLSVLVSNDTFAVHLASALGIPVVGLYFSTDSSIWGGASASFFSVQGRAGLRCPDFKRDAGNCTAFYGGCPGPCKEEVTAEIVSPLVLEALRSGPAETPEGGTLMPPPKGELAPCPGP